LWHREVVQPLQEEGQKNIMNNSLSIAPYSNEERSLKKKQIQTYITVDKS
jgi:hypothetical protein